ncbi:MAG: UDP-glucose 4-epimerase GalE [Bacteroidetes bacterium]|nr:UDP-glucose 4-epimerase GalE [Bacteroidota bacterium]
MNSGKKILVTGGAGYIGSHTVVSLIENGYTPVIVDDFRNAQSSVIEQLEAITNQKIKLHRVDCCDSQAMNTVFEAEKPNGVIHFAAYKAVNESVEKPLEYYKNNLQSLLVVLELYQKHKVQSLVFSSSCTVYGEPKGKIEVDESFPIEKAFSPYGQTKIICEQIIQDFHHSQPDSKIISLRYFNPVGAHASALIGEYPIGKPNNLLPYITQTAIGKLKQLTVFGNDYATSDGTCVRDYIHVCDLADAHVQAISFLEKETNGVLEAVNIGTGKGTSVQEIIETFETETGVSLNYTIGPRRAGDVEAIYANTSKSEKILQWKAKRSLKDSVCSAWNWEKNIKKNGY